MRPEIEQLLMSIRMADPLLLETGKNRLASALRTKAEVREAAEAMMARIVDSPGSETALKARLDAMKATAPTSK